jgi:hypothetical protein
MKKTIIVLVLLIVGFMVWKFVYNGVNPFATASATQVQY